MIARRTSERRLMRLVRESAEEVEADLLDLDQLGKGEWMVVR
jgi:hypothetical protein